MGHDTGGPKSDGQKPGGSTSDRLTLVPNDTCQKSNRQEPAGSTSDHITLLLKKIRHIRTQNKITVPYISNTYETYITQKCNSLHQKYLDITRISRHKDSI